MKSSYKRNYQSYKPAYSKTQPGCKNYNISPQGNKEIICYNCHKKGHKANQCRKKIQRDFCKNLKTPQMNKPIFLQLGTI